MPAYRFWAMNGCISRIQAATDFRSAAVAQSAVSGESAKSLMERLTLELGEPFEEKREAIVAPEPGAKQKLQRLMR